MTRILAIDYGKKRIGLALSDPLGMTAQPHGFLEAGNSLLVELKKFIETWQVEKILVGHPLSLSGNPGPMANDVSDFVHNLRKKISIPIELVDERFSTAQAERLLIEGDVRRDKRKLVRDSIAAAIFLQTYLDSQERKPE